MTRKVSKIYNYLLTNGVPFILHIYPDGAYTFIIKLDIQDLYISSLDSIDYYNIKYYLKNTPADVKERLLAKYPGEIVECEYAKN